MSTAAPAAPLPAAPTSGPGPAVVARGVRLQLGATQILQGIDWQVQPGEVHAIVGANGCGKSTLIKTLLGMMPHEGSVQLHWPGPQPGTLAYVPQAIECDRTLPMTVQDFMACMLQNRPLYFGLSAGVRERIHSVLERVGMAHKLHRRMGDLSGGERQRVLLAQSLLPPAHIVLLDEPMAALDQAGMAVFESLLADWRAQRTTVIWVEHDIAAVRRLADRVSAMSRGRVLWTREPAVLADPQLLLHLFTHGHPHAQHSSEPAKAPGHPSSSPPAP